MRLLHSELSQRANIVQAFLADATKLAELQHPNVASVVESGVHAERPYCVMECVEGASFHELLRRYPTERAPQWISRVLLDALQGLSAIHQLRGEDGSPFRLAFFDVAPHNVLVGVDGIARWADFGIERAAAGAAVADVGGVGVRNAAYLSPEQVLDEGTDHRTDLFSMGVMAWTALTGERLFDAPTVNQTLENVLHLSVPRPSTIGLQPPRSFDAPCLRALKRQRRARHRSATQLHDDLARAASAHGVAPREELASLIGKTFSQDFVAHRLAVFEASQYGLDITSGDPLYEERRQDAPAALATSVPPFRMTARRRRGRGLKVALGVLSFLVLATAAIGYWAARSETPAPKESPAPSLPATVPIVWPPASAG